MNFRCLIRLYFLPSNVDGLIFNGNYIVQKSLPGFPSGMEPAFSVEHCNEVQILNNNFVGGALPKEIQIRNMERKAIRYSTCKRI